MKMSKSLYFFLSKAPFWVNAFALISTILLLLKVIFLNQVPAPVTWFVEVGVIIEAILSSVIASYFFYLIVVHKQRLDEKSSIDPIVFNLLKTVVGNVEKSITELSKASGTHVDFSTISEPDLNKIMAKVNPFSTAPLVLLPALNKSNWLEYFENQRIIVQGCTGKVISLALFVDHEVMASVTRIDFCSHFKIIEQLYSVKNSMKDLSPLSGGYYELVEDCRDLKKMLAGRYN